MIEHPRGQHAVEDSVPERQVLHVADDRLHPTLTRQLDHPLRLVDGDHARAELMLDLLGELTLAGPDLEHEPRLDLRDRLESDPARIRAGSPLLDGDAGGEAALVGVLARDDRGVVHQADAFGVTKSPRTKDDSSAVAFVLAFVSHGSTIGCPGKRRPGALPPSQELTVAPTSANSPS